MSEKFKVDFIGVGFPRCGTTWISKCLEEHPEICFSKKKEVHFFNNDFFYKKGLDFYKTFFDCEDENIIGEFTPEYILNLKSLGRIRETFPDVKIIVSMRNPVERTFSHYYYRKRRAGVKYNLEDIFDNDPHIMLKASRYSEFLDYIWSNFDKDKVLFVIHDEYKEDPFKFIKNIYNFLGVDSSFIPPSLEKEINKTKTIARHFPVLEKGAVLGQKMKRTYLGSAVIYFLKLLRINKIYAFIRNLNVKQVDINEEKETMSEKTRQKLYDYFIKDVERLEKELNKDLSIWKNAK